MPLEFPAGLTGDPSRTQVRVASQPTRGLPASSGFVDFLANNAPVRLSRGEIERLAITGVGDHPGYLAGKTSIETDALEIGDVDPSNRGMLAALRNYYRQYSVTAMGGATFYRWIFSRDEATAADPFLTFLIDTDVMLRTRLADVLIGGFTMSASPNENLAIQFPFAGGLYDFFGDPTEVAVTGTPTAPVLRRTFDEQLTAAEGDDHDVFVKVTSQTATEVTFQTKIGTAGVYSNSQTATKGIWHRVQREDGSRLGRVAEQVQVYFTGTYTAADEWEFPFRRARWAQSLGIDRPISSINTLLMIDGEEFSWPGGWTYESAWGSIDSLPDTAGQQGNVVDRTGSPQTTITPVRRVTDFHFQAKMLTAAQTVRAVMHAETDTLIPGAAVPFRFIRINAQNQVFGSTFATNTGATNKDETVRLRPETPDATYNYEIASGDSVGVDAADVIIVDCDQADF